MGMSEDFLTSVQRFVAITAVGASALRNQGGSGVIEAAHHFLLDCDLAEFVRPTEEEFKTELDKQTVSLQQAFPEGTRHWGAARKALNIFLRDALYNRFLAEKYKLPSIENWLEVPLDSRVAGRLIEEDQERNLPPWPGLKRLTPSISAQFQSFAGGKAKERTLARVHLDVYLWPKERRT